MGHVTFLGLLRQETLSLFHCENRCARKFYHRWEPIWISARAELETFIAVMILIEADWARPWFPRVLASDASLSGYGVAQSFWSMSDVSAVDRIPEVRRCRCGAIPSGHHVFESAGFRVDSRSGEFPRDEFGRPISLYPEVVDIPASEQFPEVPFHLLWFHSLEKSQGRQVFFSTTISSDSKPGPRAQQPSVQPTANQYTTASYHFSVTIVQ